MFTSFKKRIGALAAIALVAMVIFTLVAPTPLIHAQIRDLGDLPPNVADSPRVEPTGPPADGCDWYELSCSLGVLWNNAVYALSAGLLSLGAFILWLSGILLETILQYSVVDMAKHVRTDYAEMLRVTWKIFRDLANMSFIFILLYAAINTILGTGNMKKILRNVIIVALLLNFSLFFTKVVVDVSNSLTVVFYNRILQDSSQSTLESGGISVAFMEKFGLTTLWGSDTSNQVLKTVASQGNFKLVQFAIFGLIFMCVAAFIFFAIGILFLIRFVILIFLFVLSPLALAAMALPNDKYSGKWIGALTDQLIFAPVCMALLWVSLQMLRVVAPQPIIENGQFSQSLGAALAGQAGGTPPTSAIGTVMNFAIIIMFMVFALVAAKMTGAHGAGALLKTGKKWRQNAQSIIGRNTIGSNVPLVGAGWWNKKLVESERFNKLATAKPRLFGKFGPEIGVGRFVDTARRATVQNLSEQKFGGAYSRVSRDKEKKDQNTSIKENLRKATIRNDISDGIPPDLTPQELSAIAPTMVPAAIAKRKAEQEAAQQKLTRTISQMTNKEIDDVKADKIAGVAHLFTPRQLEHILEKSEKFSDGDRDKIRKARFKSIDDAVATLEGEVAERARIAAIANAVQRTQEEQELDDRLKKAGEQIRALSGKELELSGTELIGKAKFVEALSSGQMENLTKPDNTNLTAAQKQKLKDLRIEPLKAAFAAGPSAARTEALKKIQKMKPKDLANLPMDILKDVATMEIYTQQMLTKMADEMNAANIADLRREIIREGMRPGTAANPAPSAKVENLAQWLQSPSGQQFF